MEQNIDRSLYPSSLNPGRQTPQYQQNQASYTGGRRITESRYYAASGTSQQGTTEGTPLTGSRLQDRHLAETEVRYRFSAEEVQGALSTALHNIYQDSIVAGVSDKVERILRISRLLDVLKVGGDNVNNATKIVDQSADGNALINTMVYDVGMDASGIKIVLECLQGKEGAASLLKRRADVETRKRDEEQVRGQNASNQIMWARQQSSEASKRAIQEELNSRDISNDGFESLAIYTSLSNTDGPHFEKQRTIFVDTRNGLADLTGNPVSESMEILKAIKGDSNVFRFVYLFIYPEGILSIPELKEISGNIFSLLKPGGFVYFDRSPVALKDVNILREIVIPAGFKQENVVYLRGNLRCPYRYKCNEWEGLWRREYGNTEVPDFSALLVRKEKESEHIDPA